MLHGGKAKERQLHTLGLTLSDFLLASDLIKREIVKVTLTSWFALLKV